MVGRRLAVAELLRVCVERATFDDVKKSGPRWADEPHITVVTGMPRTCSTYLHNALCGVGIGEWISYETALRPFTPNARSDAAKANLSISAARSPQLLKIHPMDVWAPEECITLMQLTGFSDRFGIIFDAPEYLAEIRSTDPTDVYLEYRRILELLTYSSHSLVLKAPSHALHVDLLRSVFPKHSVFWLTRDAQEVDASFERLVDASRRVFTPAPASASIAHQWRGFWTKVGGQVPSASTHLRFEEVKTFCDTTLGADALKAVGWLAPNPYSR